MHATFPFTLFQQRRSPRSRMGSAVALACALALGPLPGHAGTPPWANAPYSYYADNAPIANVLRDFASSFSLSLELSPLVEGKVNGRFNSQNPTEFMDRMASVYGLTWFTHAGTLFVSRTTEMSTRSITAGGGSIAAYGAPAKAATLLNYCGIGRDVLRGAGGADHGVAAADSRRAAGRGLPAQARLGGRPYHSLP